MTITVDLWPALGVWSPNDKTSWLPLALVVARRAIQLATDCLDLLDRIRHRKPPLRPS